MFKVNERSFLRLLCYGLVGIVGTGIHTFTLTVMVEVFHQGPLFSSSVGFILTIVISFFLNKHFTFKGKKGGFSELIKYTIVSCFGFFINVIIMFLIVHALLLHYLIAQLIVVVVVPISNFLFNNFWVFKEH